VGLVGTIVIGAFNGLIYYPDNKFIRQYTYVDYMRKDWLDKLLYALPLRGLRQPNDDQMMADPDVRDDVSLYRDI